MGQDAAPSQNAPAPNAMPTGSVISKDLKIGGQAICLHTDGQIQVDGEIDGDIHAQILKVGENARIKGEIVANDILVQGRVAGCVRGMKVRLTSTAHVEGDIIHKMIAIENGAHFEGSVKRREDPIRSAGKAAGGTAGPGSKAAEAPRKSAAVAQAKN